MCARRTVNDLIWKEIQEKNAQFKADNDAFWEAEQVWRKWQAEDRRRKCAPRPSASHALHTHSLGHALVARPEWVSAQHMQHHSDLFLWEDRRRRRSPCTLSCVAAHAPPGHVWIVSRGAGRKPACSAGMHSSRALQ